MPNSLATLIEQLPADAWRESTGFSPEVAETAVQLYAANGNVDQQQGVLNDWIRRYQPCLFGKTAAAQGAISYCIISEDDLAKGDEHVRSLIEGNHLEWTRQGHRGLKSGFVLHVVSARIAGAQPGPEMREFARRLAAIYLNEEMPEMDRIYHDEIYLEASNPRRTAWRWKAGINYFCAQGDRRWWNDHRIPGGMAFSTNSVGHLAKSTKLLAFTSALEAALDIPPEQGPLVRIDSLEKALQVAMQTIANASDSVSGPATELLPLPADRSALPVQECPIKLPAALHDKNHCHYRGYYHTDHTLPSEYFRDCVERPSDVRPFDELDFTYLFHRHTDNPAYLTMGSGAPIRASGDLDDAKIEIGEMDSRAFGEEISIDEAPRLLCALQRSAE